MEGLHIQDVDNHVDKLLDVDGIFYRCGDKTSFRAFIWKVINRRKRIYYRRRRRCYKYSGNLCCRGWKKQKSSSGGDGGVRWCQLCVFSRAISSKCLIFRQFKLFYIVTHKLKINRFLSICASCITKSRLIFLWKNYTHIANKIPTKLSTYRNGIF